jgi:hypothetical protein
MGRSLSWDGELMRPSRSLLTGALGVVVMLAALLVVGRITNQPARPALPGTQQPPPVTATAPSFSQPTSPATALTSPSPPQPPRLRGAPLAGTGLAVVLVPAPSPHGRPARFALDTGQTTPVEGLLAGGCYGATRLPYAWVLQRQAYGSPQAICPSPRMELYLLPDDAHTAVRVGSVDGVGVVPAADGSGLWLITNDRPPNPDTGSIPPQHVHKVALAGQSLTPSYPVPDGYAVVQGLGGDLLLLTRSQQGPGYTSLYAVWSARSGRVLRRFDRVLAASARTIAWVASTCGPGRCRVHLTDLGTGSDTTFPAPPGAWATGGVFSPDGRWLAVTVSGDVDLAGRARSQAAAVLNTTTRRLLAVPGSTISADLGLGLGWSPGGTWLLVSTPAVVDAHRQVAAWRLGRGGPAIGDCGSRACTFQPATRQSSAGADRRAASNFAWDAAASGRTSLTTPTRRRDRADAKQTGQIE